MAVRVRRTSYCQCLIYSVHCTLYSVKTDLSRLIKQKRVQLSSVKYNYHYENDITLRCFQEIDKLCTLCGIVQQCVVSRRSYTVVYHRDCTTQIYTCITAVVQFHRHVSCQINNVIYLTRNVSKDGLTWKYNKKSLRCRSLWDRSYI